MAGPVCWTYLCWVLQLQDGLELLASNNATNGPLPLSIRQDRAAVWLQTPALLEGLPDLRTRSGC